MRTIASGRRAALTRIAAGAAMPAIGRAQGRAMPFTIAFLSSNAPEVVGANVRKMEARLAELGFVEGRNVVYERRYASGVMDRLPSLAEDLLRQKPDLIIAVNNAEIGVLKRMTSNLPIVMVLALDATGNGLVESLARPGGNLTGVQTSIGVSVGKQLQFLKEMVPTLEHVAILRQRRASSTRRDDDNDVAARTLGLRTSLVEVVTAGDFEPAFAAIRASGARALTVEAGPLNYLHAGEIAAFASDTRLPAAGNARRYAEQGLLMSFGPDLSALYRRAGDYAAKILHGAKASDLPVEGADLVEFVLNLKTAARLGITIPKHLLLIANDVIR